MVTPQFLGRGVPQVALTHLLKNKAWVGGRWVAAISRKTYPVCNPVSREVIAEVGQAACVQLDCLMALTAPPLYQQVPDMGAEDAGVAVQDAFTSHKPWADRTSKVILVEKH